MSGKFQPFLAILSGVLLSCAIANPIFPTGFAPAAVVALVPLYSAIKNCRNYGEAMRCTALQALAVHLLSSYHLMFFRDFAVFTLGASALATAGIASLFGALMYFPLKGVRGGAGCAAVRGRRFDISPMGGFDTIFVQGASIHRRNSGRAAALGNPDISSGKNHSTSRLVPYPLHFAMVYMLYDWYKAEGIGFLAYPWGTLPSAADGFPCLQQTADLCGVWGVSLMLALSSAVIGEAILVVPHCINGSSFLWDMRLFNLWCMARLCVVLLLSASIYGTVQLGWVRTPVKIVTAVVVQQNSDPWVSDEANNILSSERLTEDALNALKQEGRRADVVVWSEGVLNKPFPVGEKLYADFPAEMPLESFIRKMNVPFIIGGAAMEEISPIGIIQRGTLKSASSTVIREHHNAAILFDARGRYLGYYGKLHLVPFAEVVPGVEYEWVRRFMKRVVGFSSGWSAGNRYTLFALPARTAPPAVSPAVEVISATANPNSGKKAAAESKAGEVCAVKVSAPICFDDAFASVCRPLHMAGSEAFFNITDDSWSLTESAERQHLTVARYRSIEYRTTMLRATNSGVSAVIGPDGRITESLPLFQEAARAMEVPIYKHTITAYALMGDWLAMLCALAVALCAMECAVEARG